MDTKENRNIFVIELPRDAQFEFALRSRPVPLIEANFKRVNRALGHSIFKHLLISKEKSINLYTIKTIL